MKLPLFLILTGMVLVLFAGVALKKKSVENPYKCALGLEDHKPFLESKWTDATKATRDTMVIESTSPWDISGSGTISHHIPKNKPNDVGMSTKPSGKIQLHGGSDNQTGTATYALSVDKDGNIIDTIPKLNYNDSLQKIIDSLKVEIKKAEYILNLIDSARLK